MNKQHFIRVATAIFTVIGLVHLYRAATDTPVIFGTTLIPVEVSWIGGVALLLLALVGYKLSR